jgi:peptidyl-prolyl cis-trans isomerase D
VVFQILRSEKFKKIVIMPVFVIIIASFVLFYGYNQHDASAANAPLVEVKAPGGEFHVYRGSLDQARDQMLNDFFRAYVGATNQMPTRDVMQRIQRGVDEMELLDYAVGQAALRARSEQLGVRVSDGQLARYLREVRKMTAETLDREVAASGLSRFQYMNSQRETLLEARAREMVQNLYRPSSADLYADHRLRREKLTGVVVRLPIADFIDSVEATEAEIAAEYEKVKAEAEDLLMKRPERVYRYVKMAVPPPAPPTEEQLRALYDSIPATDPEMAGGTGTRVRQILFGIDRSTAAPEDIEKLRAEAMAARERLRAGEDFLDLAREAWNATAQRDTSGMITSQTLASGLVTYPILGDADVPAWGRAWVDFANTASPGAESDVIETPLGFSILKIETRGVKMKKLFEEVARTLADRAGRKAREAALQQLTERFRAATAEESTLEGIANALSLKVGQTSPTLATSTFIPGIGMLQREKATLDDLLKGEVSPVLVTGSGDLVVLMISEEIPARLRTIGEARELLAERVRQRKASDLALARANEIRDAVVRDDRLTTMALATWAMNNGVDYEELAEPFTRATPPPQLMDSQEFPFLSLRQESGTIGVYRIGNASQPGGYAVVQLEAKNPVTRTEFQTQLDRGADGRFLYLRREGIMRDFFRDAPSALKVKYSPLIAERYAAARRN